MTDTHKEQFVYNTTRNNLIIKEYGRNVQMMVEKLLKINDLAQRTQEAQAVIKVMSLVNPENKENEKLDTAARKNESDAYWRKLWDHLFIISNYRLEIESPFPKPDPKEHQKSTTSYAYSKGAMKNRSYGRNIENMIKVVAELPEEERAALAPMVTNHFKKIYLTHNKKSVEDETIISQIQDLSDGKFILPDDIVLESTKRGTCNNGEF